jgi:hypothetical protein
MCDVHTWTIRRVDLLLTMVLLPHVQLIKFTSNVVGCSRVCIPCGINPIRWSNCRIGRLLFSMIIGIKSLPAPMNYVAFFVTELTLDWAPLVREMHSETPRSVDLEQPRVHAPGFQPALSCHPWWRQWLKRAPWWYHQDTCIARHHEWSKQLELAKGGSCPGLDSPRSSHQGSGRTTSLTWWRCDLEALRLWYHVEIT